MDIYYVLDDTGKPVKAESVEAWNEWMRWNDPGAKHRQIAYDVIQEGHAVLTVFLGIPQKPGAHGPPLLFETSVHFGGTYLDETLSATREGALSTHRRMVEREREMLRNLGENA